MLDCCGFLVCWFSCVLGCWGCGFNVFEFGVLRFCVYYFVVLGFVVGVKVCGGGGWDLLCDCWFVGLWVWVICGGGGGGCFIWLLS